MAEYMTEKQFAPNQVVVTEGEDAVDMYFIVSGKASVVMTILFKGAVFCSVHYRLLTSILLPPLSLATSKSLASVRMVSRLSFISPSIFRPPLPPPH
jgi:hypothetical protein